MELCSPTSSMGKAAENVNSALRHSSLSTGRFPYIGQHFSASFTSFAFNSFSLVSSLLQSVEQHLLNIHTSSPSSSYRQNLRRVNFAITSGVGNSQYCFPSNSTKSPNPSTSLRFKRIGISQVNLLSKYSPGNRFK